MGCGLVGVVVVVKVGKGCCDGWQKEGWVVRGRDRVLVVGREGGGWFVGAKSKTEDPCQVTHSLREATQWQKTQVTLFRNRHPTRTTKHTRKWLVTHLQC